MRVWAEIDLDKLDNNISVIREASNNKKILGIIKANAYGHGALEIARELSEIGVDFFGVACIDEAIELKKGNIKGDILILGCTPVEEWDKAIEFDFHLTVASFFEIEELKKREKHPKIHIKVDTGMGRIGFLAEEAENAIKYIRENNIADIEGLFTHFALADEDNSYTKMQMEIFEKIADKFPNIKYKHISNSAGILKQNNKYNLIRPGIILYGIVPFDTIWKDKFQSILTLKSKVVFIKEVPKGMCISYGATYKTQETERIATVSAGYADGVNRKLSNNGEVLIKGVRCSIVGRICMDQFMVRIPEQLTDIKVGDEVIIIGGEISADEVAKRVGTIPYEIMTSINVRVNRLYIKKGKIIQEKSLLGRKYKIDV